MSYDSITKDPRVKPLLKERDRLKALNAELVEALDNLTVLSKTDDGAVVIGPVGWAQAQEAIAKAKGENQ